MDKLLELIAALIGLALVLMFAPLIGLIAGAFIGFVAGIAFPDTLSLVSKLVFDTALPFWQLGAALGFLGGFMRTKTTVEGKSA